MATLINNGAKRRPYVIGRITLWAVTDIYIYPLECKNAMMGTTKWKYVIEYDIAKFLGQKILGKHILDDYQSISQLLIGQYGIDAKKIDQDTIQKHLQVNFPDYYNSVYSPYHADNADKVFSNILNDVPSGKNIPENITELLSQCFDNDAHMRIAKVVECPNGFNICFTDVAKREAERKTHSIESPHR